MRALISVSDKTGVVDFARGLRALGWEVIATGGTMKLLADSGVEVINISDVTGFPEICDGRVKTLHPNVHGGLLARRDDPEHLKALKENNIEFIIENIDIGGPSMLRSAAKNWADVTVVCDPADYAQILDEIRAGGNTEKATRLKLSAKAYTHTAEYDSMIATYMRAQAGLNEKLFLEFDLVQSLRYGENPHQSARFYREEKKVPYSLAFAKQLNGKELSYNNIQDANAALCIVREFDKPFCVGLKHMNPCGAAVGKDVVEAWTKAYEADKVSIFGGIVATNRTVTKEAAELMKPIFLEIIMAPKFDEGALEVLCTKKNLRLLEVDMEQGAVGQKQYVSVNGGLLVQDLDVETKSVTADMCVTAAKPAAEQMDDMNFGWHIVKHVKSNAIVVVKDGRTLGVGAGQMNRIGSAEIALKQAHAAGVTEGLVLASDGFFPFDDCVTLAAEYGVTAIVQPGGSVRDEDSVKKADEKGIAMVFTGERHFKH
ncbi:MAG: bifunctional phosphoribosylaminoimidazolecarboxamide formyltransferase/inosine monophosphate cyclohydrolase [Alistipes sp. 58_9_plus]|nr:MAG: bifunctional phosphoribosylaminoimidazolecarboxamide formyltransferase/inosine monophosphate cyclohydrolase [Alistipes sp. 58_9_plus]